MLKKLASRKHAKDRVVAFVVTVRALEPWARGARPRRVCIGWERGASRRGTTAVREASIANDGANARYAFEESFTICLLYTSPSPRDATLSRMPSSA